MSTQITYEDDVKREIRQMVQARGVEETLDYLHEVEQEISSKDEDDVETLDEDEFDIDDIPVSTTPRYDEVRVDPEGVCYYQGDFVRADDVIDKDVPWWSDRHGVIDRDDVRLTDNGVCVEITVDENED